jgi:hypothetical protein
MSALRTNGLWAEKVAGTTRLELATSAVTGQRSNQLNYVPTLSNARDFQITRLRNYLINFPITRFPNYSWWAVQDSNL